MQTEFQAFSWRANNKKRCASLYTAAPPTPHLTASSSSIASLLASASARCAARKGVGLTRRRGFFAGARCTPNASARAAGERRAHARAPCARVCGPTWRARSSSFRISARFVSSDI